MWFSPLKGAHLTLGQLDKTLPVDMSVENNTKIERGSFVYIKAFDGTSEIAPRFALYAVEGSGTTAWDPSEKPNAVPYIALMSVYDFQAGMAGNVGQAPKTIGADTPEGVLYPPTGSDTEKANKKAFIGATSTKGAQGFEGPRITAISVVQPAEYQTTAFAAETADLKYYVGQPLTLANGVLTPFSAGKNIVGYVTAKPKTRWINDLGSDKTGARISGGNAKVLEFSTAWIPVAGTADNVKKLDVGAPTVAKAAAPVAPAANAGAKPAVNAAPAK